MQVCPQCTHELSTASDLELGAPFACPHCGATLPLTAVHSELYDLPVPLRPSSPHLRMNEESLPVPLREAPDYRSERPRSSPPRPLPLALLPTETEGEPRLRQLLPPGVPTFSVGPISNPPATAAQITLPEQAAAKITSPSQPAILASDIRIDHEARSLAERSTTQAKPIVLEHEPPPSVEPQGSEAKPAEPTTKPIVVDPPIVSASQPVATSVDPGPLAKLSPRAGSTQSAKPISLAARSPTPSSQNSAGSQPGDMPLSTMFSMAASRQSLTSQTPQALKLGWLIAGLALAALLLLLTILVLVDRGPTGNQPALPTTGTMP